MKIEELLDRYFEGLTSCEEERELRRFFTRDRVPEQLQVYRPLFACLEEEVQALHTEKAPIKVVSPRHRFLFMMGGVAAGILLLIGIGSTHHYLQAHPENFVIIDGKQYTDANLVREQALAAFRDVRTTEDEVLDLMFE